MQMKDRVNNLKAFVGIEPTTREIVLNPPKEVAYLEKSKNIQNIEKKIKADLEKIFTPEENEIFWMTTEQNVQKFDERDNRNAEAAYENDTYWKENTKLNDSIPSILITEKYREHEYKRSEYATNNSQSKVIVLGESHYIHFEYPKQISKIIEKFGD